MEGRPGGDGRHPDRVIGRHGHRLVHRPPRQVQHVPRVEYRVHDWRPAGQVGDPKVHRRVPRQRVEAVGPRRVDAPPLGTRHLQNKRVNVVKVGRKALRPRGGEVRVGPHRTAEVPFEAGRERPQGGGRRLRAEEAEGAAG